MSNEVKFFAVVALLPLAFLSVQVASFAAAFLILCWLFFFAKPEKTKVGKSISDYKQQQQKAGEPPTV
jgi:hypothetical protein